MKIESAETIRQLQRAAEGDQQILNDLFGRYRGRLQRMIRLRMDSRLRGRIDASDVVQEAYMDATRRLGEYLENPKAPFFLWLRFLVGQKLIDLYRHHFDVKARDVRKEEFRLFNAALPEATSEVLAAQLLGHYTTPTQAAMRLEMKLRLEEALNSMDRMDREIVSLRHFEHLSNSEAAQELGIKESAASKRYIRALKKLKDILIGMGEEFTPM